MMSYEALESFTATEIVTAGSIRVEARVRYRKPGMITVEYRHYEDPLTAFEERYAGGAEFVATELTGMQFIHDGHVTWIYDAKNNVVIHKPGRTLYSPLRGVSAIAEIGFLHDLTRDFLLRDGGAEMIHGRSDLLLEIKPKKRQRSFLLKEEIFPMKKVTVALDQETFFPLRIVFHPVESSVLFYLVGPSTPITIEYKDLLFDKVDEARFAFTPPEGARVFTEATLTQEAFADKVSFDVPLQALREQTGYKLYGNRVMLTLCEENDRAYAYLTLVPPDEGKGNSRSRALSLRVGNYLSLNMNRRRALLAEQGEPVALEGIDAKFLDRGRLLKEDLPTGDTSAGDLPEGMERSIIEIGWEQDGVYWFLLGEGLEKEDLIDAAKTLAHPPTEEPIKEETL
jgi:outer membrane lipoprotein-sorting protein